MQTFLTYKSFSRCASVLDTPRLGKQRIEAVQILNTLLGNSTAWKNHPALYMWRGYEFALAIYGMQACMEWSNKRRYQDKQFFVLHGLAEQAKKRVGHERGYVSPPWFGDPDLYRSHRSNLMRKSPERYGDVFRGTPELMPYLWPVFTPEQAAEGVYDLKVSKADKALLATGERSLPPAIAARVVNLEG